MLFTTVIVSDCLAGGCAGLQAGSEGLQARSGGLQSEGWDWTLVLGSSLALVLGSLAFSVPRVHENVDNILFFEENLGPKFQFQGSQALKSSINRLVNMINKKCLGTLLVSRSLV